MIKRHEPHNIWCTVADPLQDLEQVIQTPQRSYPHLQQKLSDQTLQELHPQGTSMTTQALIKKKQKHIL